jgi:hypothetical protein
MFVMIWPIWEILGRLYGENLTQKEMFDNVYREIFRTGSTQILSFRFQICRKNPEFSFHSKKSWMGENPSTSLAEKGITHVTSASKQANHRSVKCECWGDRDPNPVSLTMLISTLSRVDSLSGPISLIGTVHRTERTLTKIWKSKLRSTCSLARIASESFNPRFGMHWKYFDAQPTGVRKITSSHEMAYQGRNR